MDSQDSRETWVSRVIGGSLDPAGPVERMDRRGPKVGWDLQVTRGR